MIQFSKKEIQGLLENLSKDTTRPALCDVYVDTENKKLVATDGYTMVVLSVDWEKEFPLAETSGYGDYYIPAKTLSDWCKLHSTKDTITSDELAEMVEPKDYRYPTYTTLFTNFEHDKDSNSGSYDLALIHRFEKIMSQPTITMKDGILRLDGNSKQSPRTGLICAMIKH